MSDQLKDLHFLATRLQSMAADGHGYFAQNDIARMIRTADAMFAADTEITRLRAALADERKRALEEAAKVVEAEVTGLILDRFIFNGEAAKNDMGDTSFVSTTRMSIYLRNRAAAIRALKETTK